MITPNFEKGDKCKAFDSHTWSKTGDIGDNSQFWLDATILEVRQTKRLEWVADVLFSNGKVSKGHYLNGLKSV